MNDKTGGSRGPRRAGALAVLAAVAALTAGCGVVHVSFGDGSSSAGSATFRDNLAYAKCMQTHGLPSFPDPTHSEGFSVWRLPKVSGNGPAARANDACKHLLPRGSATSG